MFQNWKLVWRKWKWRGDVTFAALLRPTRNICVLDALDTPFIWNWNGKHCNLNLMKILRTLRSYQTVFWPVIAALRVFSSRRSRVESQKMRNVIVLCVLLTTSPPCSAVTVPIVFKSFSVTLKLIDFIARQNSVFTVLSCASVNRQPARFASLFFCSPH